MPPAPLRSARGICEFLDDFEIGHFGQPNKGCSSNQVGFFQNLISTPFSSEFVLELPEPRPILARW